MKRTPMTGVLKEMSGFSDEYLLFFIYFPYIILLYKTIKKMSANICGHLFYTEQTYLHKKCTASE